MKRLLCTICLLLISGCVQTSSPSSGDWPENWDYTEATSGDEVSSSDALKSAAARLRDSTLIKKMEIIKELEAKQEELQAERQDLVIRLKRLENPTLPTETPPITNRPIATNNLTHKSIVYSARYAIRQCLKSPSSASFPVWPDNSYGVTTLENNTYLASGKVTSKNAFGVKLQNTWITKLEFSGSNLETVRATYVKIGNEVLLDVP